MHCGIVDTKILVWNLPSDIINVATEGRRLISIGPVMKKKETKSSEPFAAHVHIDMQYTVVISTDVTRHHQLRSSQHHQFFV